MNIYYKPYVQIRKMLEKRQISASEITKIFLARIKSVEPKVKAYISIAEEDAINQAKALDKKIAKGIPCGTLCGAIIAVKDNILVKSMRTTCASNILKDFISPYDAYVIKRIKEEDGIVVGKTNLDEFGMGSSTENSAFFTTRNPWNLEYVPGGSSGGSAAAVSYGGCSLSLGSDTGGSIRQPASFTGVVGFKPTYGAVSRYGLVAFASSLDQIGPITRCVEDTNILFKTIYGKDVLDSTSVGLPNSHLLPLNLEPPHPKSLNGIKLGIVKEYFEQGVDKEIISRVQESIKILEKLGANCLDVSLPSSKYSIETYYIIAPAEASSNLARYDGIRYGSRICYFDSVSSLYSNTRAEGFGKEVKRRIMIGGSILRSGYYETYYVKALKVRRLIKEDFDRIFSKVDLLCGPTTPFPAFKVGEKVSDPIQMYLCDMFTVGANLAGLPAISIPCGFTSHSAKLPIGFQIQGKIFDDIKVINTAYHLEQELKLENIPPL